MNFLILNQAFYPDVVATSQHAGDLALELSARGHSVTVISSSRAYDDPGKRFPSREIWNGVTILRIPCTGFGKHAKWRRAIDFGTYIAACVVRLVFLRRRDVVIALTSPPLISFIGALFTALKGGHFVFWVMDMNPDEAIAAGWLRPDSVLSRALQWMLEFSLKRADLIIALDRFMRRRIEEKGINSAKIRVVPPWAHDDSVRFDRAGRDAFRTEHGFEDKFVVMYSGNHSPCHPLDTLLGAAERLSANEQIRFCFIGGGSEFLRVQNFAHERSLGNVICLPYQSFSRLSSSLSAADLHVVVMGDRFLGIVHPCKIYNVLAIGVPLLYIGPNESHVGDIMARFPRLRVFAAAHGDTDVVVSHILQAADARTTQVRLDEEIVNSYGKKRMLAALVAELTKLGSSAAATA